jgi:glycosyltransferase involved in cell wall biosynthesis
MRILAWPAFSDNGNPYNRLLYGALREVGTDVDVSDFRPLRLLLRGCDIWHLHWPERITNAKSPARVAFNLVGFLLLVFVARLRRTRIVWTVHNLQAHNSRRPWLESWFMGTFSRVVDGFIALTPKGAHAARRRHPGLRTTPHVVIPHGHFLDVCDRSITREEARRRLGIAHEAHVISYVGRISAYKNVPELVEAFVAAGNAQARLLVAGDVVDNSAAEAIKTAAAGDERVLLELRTISDAELALFVLAADLVVLPFRQILNSSSVLLALSLARPVLVPTLGTMTELEEQFGADWVMLFDAPLTSEALADKLERSRSLEREDLEVKLRNELDWRYLAGETARFYREIAGAGGGAK